MAKNRDIMNREFSIYVSHNSKEDFEKAAAVNNIRVFNMKKTDYESKNKANLKFATFDNSKKPDPNLAFDLTAAGLSLISLKQQSEPFPKKYTNDTPDRLKSKLGFPVENSFSSSSSEDKYKKPRTSTESSDIFIDSDNFEQWAEVKNKKQIKTFNFDRKNSRK
jgi:hypothetical protein